MKIGRLWEVSPSGKEASALGRSHADFGAREGIEGTENWIYLEPS